MKKPNALMLSFLLTGSLVFFGCGGEKSTETESAGTEMEGMETEKKASQEQRASPLREIAGKIGDKDLKIQYGAPSVKGRVVWGDIAPYNEVWRTGANEATFVEFSKDVLVEGKELPAGKYSLFTIPKATGKWTVIFNSEWDLEHGHFQYKLENDVLRVESQPLWEESSQEQLTIAIESPGIVVRWEKLKLPIAIQ
ncbi:DUF2911 domain-containing protein [Rhodonellum sp.]|uniref:DUF2911 domain-containing protein n=1 Tax=Rhodonellum sp. TaxID=2231180 RepID=UPI002725B0FD|nr:DUF2911 domain-containing protein [Rhodonellum sp.]MDO9553256.1 DUF2911 domain-containing protein [Rhodonellum sp.]